MDYCYAHVAVRKKLHFSAKSFCLQLHGPDSHLHFYFFSLLCSAFYSALVIFILQYLSISLPSQYHIYFYSLTRYLYVFILFLIHSSLCNFLSYLVLSYLSYPILSYPILSYPILFYLILSYPILSSPILSYSILFYTILSYPILSYPILSYSILYYPILSYPILIVILFNSFQWMALWRPSDRKR